jgi:hypothetical protein
VEPQSNTDGDPLFYEDEIRSVEGPDASKGGQPV